MRVVVKGGVRFHGEPMELALIKEQAMGWLKSNKVSIETAIEEKFIKTIDDNTFEVPRGIAEDIYDLNKAEWNVCRDSFDFSFNGELRDYQAEAVEETKKYNNGLILLPTATGKTHIAFGAAYANKLTTLFICNTTEVMNQTAEKAEKALGIDIGIIADGKRNIQPFTIALIQSLYEDISDITDKFGMIYVDECLTGDSLIHTEKGVVKLKDVASLSCKNVLTWDGEKCIMKEIEKWWQVGERDILKIKTNEGEVKCTPEHPIMTMNGWKKAEEITVNDYVLCLANADAEPHLVKHQSKNKKNIFVGTMGKKEPQENGIKNINKFCLMPHYVSVGAAKRLGLEIQDRWKILSIIKELLDIIHIYLDTIKNQSIIILSYLKKKLELLLVRCLGIHQYAYRIQDQKITEYISTTQQNKKIGQYIKLIYSKSFVSKKGLSTILVMAKNSLERIRVVYHVLATSQVIYLIKMAKNILQKKHYQNLEQLAYLGGYVTMEAIHPKEDIFSFIHMASAKNQCESQPLGLDLDLDRAQLEPTKEEGASILVSKLMPQIKSSDTLNHMFQNVCNIKYSKVESVEKINNETVYDITVKDTHCYFANGMLVHNCHHIAGEVYFNVISKFASLKKFGTTATIKRRDCKEYAVYAVIGGSIYKKEVSKLKEYLSIPNVYPVYTKAMYNKEQHCKTACQYHAHCKPVREATYDGVIDWEKIKKGVCRKLDFSYYRWITEQYMKDDDRNNLIINTFEKHKGNNNLFLCDRVPHTDLLATKLVERNHKNVFCLHGKSKNREHYIDIFKKDGGTIVGTTSLFGEGFDAPDIDRLFLVTPSASAARITQKIGRIMRKKEGVTAEVYDFVDMGIEICKIMWYARKRIYDKLKAPIIYPNKEDKNDEAW